MSRYQTNTFDDYEAKTGGQKVALKACRELKHDAIMTGNIGTGKTMLANCIANQRDKYPKKVITTLAKISREFRSTFNGGEFTEQELMDMISKTDLLVVDEIGVSKIGDFEYRYLNEIIDNRYDNKLPTIIISNLTVDELKVAIGDRLIDRLKEDGVQISFTWDSYR